MSMRNLKFAEQMGNKIGRFVEADQTNILVPSKALKIKVDYDLQKPLRQGLMLKLNDTPSWFKMKDVKLPDFYVSATEKHSQRKKVRCHRFENFWALDNGCANIVENTWSLLGSSNPTFRCMEKIGRCMKDLAEWNNSTYGNLQCEIKKLQSQLLSTTTASDRKHIFDEIGDLRRKEEVLWWQRSRTDFLHCGYSNSAWFHHRAS
ncbi:hypothetical protein Cgig2_004984 [Carnegiea gigantea]|uniref:Uncharacterized protein n=1 Tax=Carnegiea gigantea TaxID=171969 RepID=A0A9Q1L005_9CARY|nr:hypothetical protein Cgig2_004984 [Carnegiea gigantea]